MKDLLTTAPILKVADPNKDFIVCVDASKEGIGGVLTQEGHMICYESWKLKEHEKLCHSWIRIGSSNTHLKNVVTLHNGQKISIIYG